jgi:cobalt-zinc-cadmium efflux system protein
MLFLQATPDIELIESIKSKIVSKAIVGEVHHLHIWSLDGENNVLTAHIVLNTEISNKELKSYKLELQHELKEFDFAHTTIEIEFMNETCRDAS